MFNNSENDRTVLTHVERGMYCYIFFYIVVGYTISIVKGYYGPYPSILCWWLKWIYNFVPIGLLLSFCVNIIIRVSLKANLLLIQSNILFVCNRGDTYYSITAGSRQGSFVKPLSLLFLTPRPALSSHQHRTLVCLF